MAVKGKPNTSNSFIGSSIKGTASSELRLTIYVGAAGAPQPPSLRDVTSIPITFAWSETVDGFTYSDIDVYWYDENKKVGALGSFPPTNGTSLFTSIFTIPDDTRGEVRISVNNDVATASLDNTKTGPPSITYIDIKYDNTTEQPNPPTVLIRDIQQQPWKPTTLPFTIVWSEDVTQFIAADIEISTGTLGNFSEVQPDIYTAEVTLPANSTGTLTITIPSECAQGAQRKGPENDYVKSFTYNTTGVDKDIPGTTTLAELTFNFADNPHFSGAFCNVMELVVHSGYVYLFVQFVRDRGSTPTNFLAWDTVGAGAIFRVPTTGGTLERIEKFEDVLAAGRSLTVLQNEIHYFHGSHYAYRFADSIRPSTNPDWRASVGTLYKLLNGTMRTEVAQTGKTGQTDNANPKKIRDADGDLIDNKNYDPYYAVRGGTASPLVPYNDGFSDKLFMIPGFGDLRETIGNLIANTEVDDLRNWQLMLLTDILQTRLPVLETNDKPAYETLKMLALITRSRFGFRGNQFRFEPADPRTAKIKTAVNATATTLDIKDFSRVTYPSTGTIFIDGELLTYTGFANAQLTGLHRGAFETTAAAHTVDADVIFVDHRYSDFVDIRTENNRSQLYNKINVHYGNDKTHTESDATSITAYGTRVLDIPTALGPDQKPWAVHIAKQFLAAFKTPKTRVSLVVDYTRDVQIGDVLFIKQTDRAHLAHCAQVNSVKLNAAVDPNSNRARTTEIEATLI